MRRRTISERENWLRAVEFSNPEWIPVKFELMPAVWMRYGAQLQELVDGHPLIFDPEDPGGYSFNFHAGDPFYTANEYFTDEWGCGWHNTQAGLLGQVIHHPLADWGALASFRPPNPRDQYDWRLLGEDTEWARRAGRLTQGNYEFTKGGFFDRLQFLRGLENLLIDFMEESPQLWSLIEMVLDCNMRYIRLWLDIGVDLMFFHGDIGSQKNLIMSPATFRKVLKPAYAEMFGTCRRAGAHVWYSSDGHMLPIVDDLIECGVSLHDPQVRANSIEGVAKAYKGKLCALVDIDEQMLPYCSPEDIKQQIRQVRETMYLPQGGLMIYCIPSQDVPLENIEALCAGWEEICWM